MAKTQIQKIDPIPARQLESFRPAEIMEALDAYIKNSGIMKDLTSTTSKSALLASTPKIDSTWKTFTGAVLAFNRQDWDAYQEYLDANVIAYNLEEEAYVKGREAVISYFRKKGAIYFEPTNDMTWEPERFPLSVRGIAFWTNTSEGHRREPFKYKFQFHPESYLLTMIWGEHIDKRNNP